MSIILAPGDDPAESRRLIASLLSDPPKAPIEFVFAVTDPSDAMLRLVRELSNEHAVRLFLLRHYRKRMLHLAWNLGARGARGRILIFARSAPGLRGSGLWEAFGAALDDPRVGVVGVETAWRQTLREPSPRSSDLRYSFSRLPVNDALFGIRAETFWQSGGFHRAHGRGGHGLELQYRLVRANYRLALARGLAGRGRVGLRRRDARFVRYRYPVFSVAIATRNYGRWLPRCLDSVLRCKNPTGAPVQIVVADDASTDDTAAILAGYRRRFPRNITPVPIRASGGVPAAKNAAIRRCIGKYVALLDADDEFAADKIARCHAELYTRPGTELLTHDYTFIDDQSGARSVTQGNWAGGWRPPGVWVFRNGLVRFNEQMVCGYEELEWTNRCWQAVRRRHIAAPLAVVHGTSVRDRWKVDREVAGAQTLTRWDHDPKDRRNATAFACRDCGNQYLRRVSCCGRGTEEVPLVCYMVVASGPGAGPVALSVIVFVGDDLSRTRKMAERVRREAGTAGIEWVFVHCHPRSRVVAYLREFATAARVKAIFTPPSVPLVYGHDANRAARAAAGKDLVLLSTDASMGTGRALAGLREGLEEPRTGLAGLAAGRTGAFPHAGCWGIRQEAFWDLGGMDERLLAREEAVRDLGRRARGARYRVIITGPARAPSALRSLE
jgi:hypothetical protein